MAPDNKALSLAALAQIEAAARSLLSALAAARGAASPEPEPMTVTEVCNEFLLSKAKAHRSDRYLKLSLAHLKAFSKGREGQPCASLTAVEIEDWLHAQDWSQRTKRGALQTIRAVLNLGVARGYLAGNVALGVDLPTVDPSAPAIHTPAQVAAVLRSLAGHDPDVCRFMAIRYFAGLRQSEALLLEESQIKRERGFIEVTAAQAKTRSRRLVTIQPALAAWLDLGGRLPFRQQCNRLAQATRATGVPWPQNVTRHSFVSYHLAHFKNAAQTALEAGHTEQMLFKHYRELVTPDEAAQFWAVRPTA